MFDKNEIADRLNRLEETIRKTGDIEAKYNWAYYYQFFDDDNAQTDKAREYFEECISEDYEPMWSRYYLAIIPSKTEEDQKRTTELYKEILEMKYLDYTDMRGIVLYQLGKRFIEGTGTRQDYKQAYDCFLEGSKVSKNIENLVGLGDCYYNGWNVETDKKRAFDIYNEALEQSHEFPDVVVNSDYARALVLERIGRCYMFGEGVQKDLIKAREHLEDSTDVFDSETISALQELAYLETLEDEESK